VDEAQDLNRLQWDMLFHSLVGESTNILVVGDQFQALYGFTGVDVERPLSIIPAATFESLGGGRKVRTMSITQCRRCPVGVVDMVKALAGADNIAEHPDKGAGEIQVVPFDLRYPQRCPAWRPGPLRRQCCRDFARIYRLPREQAGGHIGFPVVQDCVGRCDDLTGKIQDIRG
jgi:hypothetical protein